MRDGLDLSAPRLRRDRGNRPAHKSHRHARSPVPCAPPTGWGAPGEVSRWAFGSSLGHHDVLDTADGNARLGHPGPHATRADGAGGGRREPETEREPTWLTPAGAD